MGTAGFERREAIELIVYFTGDMSYQLYRNTTLGLFFLELDQTSQRRKF